MGETLTQRRRVSDEGLRFVKLCRRGIISNVPCKKGNIQIPPELFNTVLPALKDVDEIRLVLILFWYLQSRDENTGYAAVDELMQEPVVQGLFDKSEIDWIIKFQAALNKAVADQIILSAIKGERQFLFINSPRGAALCQGLASGDWVPGETGIAPHSLAQWAKA